MRGNIAQLMQQAQRMQENVKRAQEELAHVEVQGQSGGGMVKVTLSGRMECRSVRIDPAALADPEMAEDLIAAAFNDAVAKANEESQKRMSAATAGLPIPAGMKLPGLL
jgi:DNA-binding YbaB/EbfC family protein